MNIKLFRFIFVILCSVGFFVDAELLIVKQDKNCVMPLTEREMKRYGSIITQALLKYQWPMCSTSQDLTDQEKQELLSSDQPCGEELFIEKQLRQEIGKDIIDPVVVFIPTTLYELFCIHQFFQGRNQNKPLYQAGCKYLFDHEKRGAREPIDLSDILNSHEDDKSIYRSVHQIYHQVNDYFYHGDEQANLYVNQACIDYVLAMYPQLKNCKNG